MDNGRDKNPFKHNFFGPWANKLHAHFVFKNEKKCVKNIDQSQLFWTMS
jgi:hypothetical protein